MTEELFHEELIAMHLHEQDYRSERPNGYPNWFGLNSAERRKYRLRARSMMQEAREPRG